VWPPSFALAGAYLDQLERSNELARGRGSAIRSAIAAAEKEAGAGRRDALARLAAQLEGDATASRNSAKVRMLAGALRDLSAVSR